MLKGKGKIPCWLTKYLTMKTYGGMEVHLHPFLTSALDGDGCSVLRPGRFTLAERAAGIHWIRDCVGRRAWTDAVAKRKIPCPYEDSNSGRPASNLIVVTTQLTTLLQKLIVWFVIDQQKSHCMVRLSLVFIGYRAVTLSWTTSVTEQQCHRMVHANRTALSIFVSIRYYFKQLDLRTRSMTRFVLDIIITECRLYFRKCHTNVKPHLMSKQAS
jgi:hypothetical protein